MSEMSDYTEARHHCILRPQRPKRGQRFDTWITKDSAKWQRLPTIQLRRYQAIECQDGMQWDTCDRVWNDLHIYTFTDWIYPVRQPQAEEFLIGMAAFSTGAEFDRATLVSCWIHPFYRRQRRLAQAWPIFKAKFGEFDIDWPNASMRSFLTHIKHPIAPK